MKLLLLIITYAGLLIACGSTPTKKQESVVRNHVKILTPASGLHKYGLEHYQKWQKTGDLAEKTQAQINLEGAYKIRPDDINIQYSYLTYLYAASNLDNETQLLEVYNALSPLVRNEFTPPATFSYVAAKQQNEGNGTLYAHLARAIEQNGYSPQAWTNMSDFFLDLGLPWQALGTASKAYELAPDSDYYVNKLGIVYTILALMADCPCEETDILKKAAGHHLGASRIDPENSIYVSNASIQYINLGVFPLAYSQAKKTYTENPTLRIAAVYAYSAALLDKWGEAETAINYIKTNHSRKELEENPFSLGYASVVTQALAMRSGENNTPSSAFFKHETTDTYKSLFSPMVQPISAQEFSSFLSTYVSKESAMMDISSFLNGDIDEDFAQELMEDATDRCAKSRWYFAFATKAVQNHDEIKKNYYLKKVLEQKNFRSKEYLWSKVLLERHKKAPHI